MNFPVRISRFFYSIIRWFIVSRISENDLLYLFNLATCEEISCDNYAKCVTIDRQPKCQCPKDSDCSKKRDAVCGSDGMVYLNECYMRVSSCEAGVLVTVTNKGVCGKLINFATMNYSVHGVCIFFMILLFSSLQHCYPDIVPFFIFSFMKLIDVTFTSVFSAR